MLWHEGRGSFAERGLPAKTGNTRTIHFVTAKDKLNRVSELISQKGMTFRDWYRTIYLTCPHWTDLRKKAFTVHGRKCHACRSEHQLDVHHLNYRNIFDVEVGDLQILCRRCHEKEHSKKSYRPEMPTFGSLPSWVMEKIHVQMQRVNPCGAKAKRNCSINRTMEELRRSNALTPELELEMKASKSGATARYYKSLKNSGIPAHIILTKSRSHIRKLLKRKGSGIVIPPLGH